MSILVDLMANAVDDVAVLQQAGAHSRTEFTYGGHDFNVWRGLLRDFLLQDAFKPLGT